MLEAQAMALVEWVAEYLNQQIPKGVYTLDLLHVGDQNRFLIKVSFHQSSAGFTSYQKALSLLASQMGDVGKLSIPSGSEGLTLVKVEDQDALMGHLFISDTHLHVDFWNINEFDVCASKDVSTAFPGVEACLDLNKVWVLSRYELSVKNRSDLLIGGFRGPYGAQQVASQIINIGSVGAVTVVKLTCVPEASRNDFKGAYALILCPKKDI